MLFQDSGPLGTIYGAADAQKVLDWEHCAGGILLLRNMTELVKDHQFASHDVGMKTSRGVGRSETVVRPPKDKRGQAKLRDAVLESAERLALPCPLEQRHPVTFAQRNFVGAFHHFRRHLAGIGEDT